MNKQRSILSTSMLEGDALQYAAAAGIDMDTMPFIFVSYIEDDLVTAQVEALAAQQVQVVFTSKHAVKAVRNILKEKVVDWSIFCLGNSTKNIVNQCFNENIIIGVAQSAEELAGVISAHNVSGVVFFCGDLRLDTLPDRLKKAGVEVHEYVVYRSIETPHTAEKQYDGILFFSPSGVHSFFGNNTVDDNTTLFAIGQTTAEIVRSYTNNKLVVSKVPSKLQVVTDAVSYLNSK